MTRGSLLEIWGESRARPVNEPEIVIGVRNTGWLPSDWIVNLEGTIRIEGPYHQQEIPFQIQSIGSQETRFFSQRLSPLPVGTYRITLLDIRWGGEKREALEQPIEWEMVFFEKPPEVEIPYTSGPLSPASDLFQDTFREGLEHLVKEWRRSREKCLGFCSEASGGKTTVLRRAETLLTQLGERVLSCYLNGPSDGLECAKKLKDVITERPEEPKFVVIDNFFNLPSDALEILLKAPRVYCVYTDEKREWAHEIPWLSEEAVKRMVAQSPVPMDHSVSEGVWEWTRGHPLLVQIVLETLCLERQSIGYIHRHGVDILLGQAADIHTATLDRLWGRFRWEERMVLVAVARWSDRRQGLALRSDVLHELQRQIQPAARSFARIFPEAAFMDALEDPEKGAQRLEDSARQIREVLAKWERGKQELGLEPKTERAVERGMVSAERALRDAAGWMRERAMWLRGMPHWPRRTILRGQERHFRGRVGASWEKVVELAPLIEKRIQHSVAPSASLLELEIALREGVGLLPTAWVEETLDALLQRGWLIQPAEGQIRIGPLLLHQWLRRETVEFASGPLEPYAKEVGR
jgi:hypothetical protein